MNRLALGEGWVDVIAPRARFVGCDEWDTRLGALLKRP